MNPQDAIDFSREALRTCMMVGGPILIASLLIGLLVGIVQAMTQVQDQTVSFVPKILLVLLMIGICLPWLTDHMLDFAKRSFETPMTQWAGNAPKKKLFPARSPDTEGRPDRSAMSLPDHSPWRQIAPLISAQQTKTNRSVAQKSQSDTTPLDFPSLDSNATNESPFILPHYRKPVSSNSISGQ